MDPNYQPLPAPVLIQSVTPLAHGQSQDPDAHPPTARHLHVVKRNLPFNIKADSIECVDSGNGHICVSFKYLSNSPMRANVTLSDECGNVVVHSELLLPATARLSDTVANEGQWHDASVGLVLPRDKFTSQPCMDLEVVASDAGTRIVMHGKTSDRMSVVVTDMKLYTEGDDAVIDLLNLFGTVSSHGISGSGSSRDICGICLTEPATVVFLPCRHLGFCSECAPATLSSIGNRCPMCRSVVSGQIQLE